MFDIDGKAQFKADIFPDECDYIRARRSNSVPAQEPEASSPGPVTHFTGLAFSGGGIRSASFCCGVSQLLIEKGLFNKMDYLSTVSGGGYIGACLSAITRDGPGNENLFIERANGCEPPALNHIRNYSKYLSAEGFGSSLRIPVLFIEGAMRSIFSFLPIIIGIVFLTELFFELTGPFGDVIQLVVPILGVVPLIVLLTLRPLMMGNVSWIERDRCDRWLTTSTLIAIFSIVSIPFLALLRNAVELDATTFTMQAVEFFGFIQIHLKSGVVAIILASVSFALLARKHEGKVLILALSLVAPLAILALYILLCVHAINSPYVDSYNYTPPEGIPNASGNFISGLHQVLLDLSPDERENTGVPAFSGCNPGAAQALQLSSYTKIEPTIKKIFTQKQIDYDGYCLKSASSDRLVFENIAESKPAMKQYGKMLVSFLFQGQPSQLTLILSREYLTERPLLIIDELRLLRGHAQWWLYLLGILIQLYNWSFLNVNCFSLNTFYRDRLSRTFLISYKNGTITSGDEIKLSEINTDKCAGPYHLINTALNLQGSANPQLRSRKTVSFLLSKAYCGSDYTGYCRTEDLEKDDKHFNLGTAVAISAAAASPNMGTVGIPSLAFIMTLLNMRLNYWLPHPGRIVQGLKTKCLIGKGLGVSYLWSEARAKVNEKMPYLNCSDGGHFENLGVIELLKRHCNTIVCVDAEADPNFEFAGLTTLQRYAEIDFGIKIDLDLRSIKPSQNISANNFSVGTINYPDSTLGTLIYLKLAYTGKEAEYLDNYRKTQPAFPHESTGDQFFDETQFEVYRALGYFTAHNALDAMRIALT